MTNFKIFETVNQLPKNGDYFFSEEYGSGQLIKKCERGFEVKLDNMLDPGLNIVYIDLSEIEYWSSDKKELEMYIDAKKYNI
jgi:hypothetical protein